MTESKPTHKPTFPTYKDHLNKTFLEELNYKLWSTKGIRFKASKRLLTQDNLSNKALGFLSSYLIILGLLSVYKITGDTGINEKLLAFGTTTLSILLLAFSQMEAAQDFKIKARNFQDCALNISRLYDELRIFKTLTNPSDNQNRKFASEISTQYENILERNPNHNDIDYQIFRIEHQDYFKLTNSKFRAVRFRYYIEVKLLYHVLIIIPPVVIIVILFLT
ncbi:MAG: SLATT domain-containing protein [Cyclobacteriaceae bacterium]